MNSSETIKKIKENPDVFTWLAVDDETQVEVALTCVDRTLPYFYFLFVDPYINVDNNKVITFYTFSYNPEELEKIGFSEEELEWIKARHLDKYNDVVSQLEEMIKEY